MMRGKGKIFVRFRNINIILFTAAFIVTAAVMYFAFDRVTNQISAQYAGRYAVSTALSLSSHISREIDNMTKSARSFAVTEWLRDEFNEDKKIRAFEEMRGIVGDLYSFNLYVGIEGSLNEYRVESGTGNGNIEPISVLSRDEPMDAWYFMCINSGRDYILSVDIDHFMQRKRVWIDYKVEKDGVPLGVICTGLEFSHVAGELFSHYDSNNMRGLIIANDGTILMDSSLMKDSDFLFDIYETNIKEEFSNAAVIRAIEKTLESHLVYNDAFHDEINTPAIIDISPGVYRFMTMTTIKHTDWSVVIFSDTTTLFDTTYFVPIIITVLALLIAFAISSSAANYRLIFRPLGKLDQSLNQLNEHSGELIYGTERDDELGHLSNTIQDLFNKANIDPLTGLYNRRFMDSSMERIMGLLSRAGGQLSVLMLDIDFFKRFNDTYGHEEGDLCLSAVANALSECATRLNDIVIRYGGEEFTVILPNTDTEGACKFAEKLLAHVIKLKIPHVKNDASEFVTVSIGITTRKVEHTQEFTEFLKRADEALYISKDSGRNKYTYLDF